MSQAPGIAHALGISQPRNTVAKLPDSLPSNQTTVYFRYKTIFDPRILLTFLRSNIYISSPKVPSRNPGANQV